MTEHTSHLSPGATAYSRGCRCEPCTEANTQRCAGYRAVNRHRIQATKRTWWINHGRERQRAQRQNTAGAS